MYIDIKYLPKIDDFCETYASTRCNHQSDCDHDQPANVYFTILRIHTFDDIRHILSATPTNKLFFSNLFSFLKQMTVSGSFFFRVHHLTEFSWIFRSTWWLCIKL